MTTDNRDDEFTERCDVCREEAYPLREVTARIDYNFGPIMASLCRDCDDDPEAEWVAFESAQPHPMAVIREMR